MGAYVLYIIILLLLLLPTYCRLASVNQSRIHLAQVYTIVLVYSKLITQFKLISI